MQFIVPPGGFAGYSQMTPASKAALGGRVSGSRAGGRRRRRKKKAKAKAKRARSGTRKLKFGTPAWRKKYMRKRK